MGKRSPGYQEKVSGTNFFKPKELTWERSKGNKIKQYQRRPMRTESGKQGKWQCGVYKVAENES